MKQRYAKLDETGRVQFAVFDSETDAKNAGYLPYEERNLLPRTTSFRTITPVPMKKRTERLYLCGKRTRTMRLLSS